MNNIHFRITLVLTYCSDMTLKPESFGHPASIHKYIIMHNFPLMDSIILAYNNGNTGALGSLKSQ